jgi:Domain of unknown function (DUF6468)
MSPISLSLDLLLMVLLAAALIFGWRLERRLKGLKESHVDFANAVADLDRAAIRAETGLAKLREATDDAVDLLAGRIEKAREVAAKLEKLTREAASVQPSPANDAPRAPTDRRIASERPLTLDRPLTLERPLARTPAVKASSPADAILAAEALARRLAQADSLVQRTPATPIARPTPQPVQRPAARTRPSIDDELFDAPRAAMGGARR